MNFIDDYYISSCLFFLVWQKVLIFDYMLLLIITYYQVLDDIYASSQDYLAISRNKVTGCVSAFPSDSSRFWQVVLGLPVYIFLIL